ncbi:MAG: CPBP family intramembrane glutamic endopeptidase [Thermomicrobiaceae bacterium]
MEILAVVIPGIIIALVLSSWAHFANERPALAILLYVVFGLGAFAIIGFGGLMIAFADQISEEVDDVAVGARAGYFMIAAGLAAGLPLLPPVRTLIAKLIPIDPKSIPDMVGLCIMLFVSVMMLWTIDLTFAGGDEEIASASGIDLVMQAVLLVAVAFFAIGGAINRDLSSVRERLGLFTPTSRQVAISVALIVPLFLASALGGVLTEVFQPGFTDDIDEIMGEMTGDLVNLQGALLIGLTAGIGEEILLRGAIQPRYGIIFTSLVFTLIHVQYGFSFVLMGVFLSAVILGIQRRKMNTTCCIITHALYNFAAVMLSTLA